MTDFTCLRMACLLFITCLLVACTGSQKPDEDKPLIRDEVQQFLQAQLNHEVEEKGYKNPHFIIINFETADPSPYYFGRDGVQTPYVVKMDDVESEENYNSTFVINEYDHVIRFYRNRHGGTTTGSSRMQ